MKPIYDVDKIIQFRLGYERINIKADDAICMIRLRPSKDGSKDDFLVLKNEELRDEQTALLNDEVRTYLESVISAFNQCDEDNTNDFRKQIVDLYLLIPTLNVRNYDRVISNRYGRRTGSPSDAMSMMGPERYYNAVDRNKELLADALGLRAISNG